MRQVEVGRPSTRTVDEFNYHYAALGLSIGMAVGISIGLMTGMLALVISLGSCLGMMLGCAIDSRKHAWAKGSFQ